MKRNGLFWSLILVLYLTPTWSQATVILDQSFTNDTGLAVTISNDGTNSYADAQTFTVGLSGKLTSIQVELNGGFYDPNTPGNFNFNLLTTDANGAPTFNSLATITRPLASLSPNSWSWFEFDLSSFNLNVTAGQVLAIGINMPQPVVVGNFSPDLGWAGSTSDLPPTYPNGDAYFSHNNSNFALLAPLIPFPPDDADLVFKVYVDTAPVPEPCTMVLLASGLAGIAGMRLRKRAQA